MEKNQQSQSKTRNPEYSPSPKPLKNGKAQPNTKVRKLRKRIKKSKKNLNNKTIKLLLPKEFAPTQVTSRKSKKEKI